jgi:lipoate-protein ligase A
VEGEVTAAGAKLVGSAQRRDRGIILQHGSLPIDDDQSLVPALMKAGTPVEPPAPPATLSALLGRAPEWSELVAALAAGWEETTGVCLDRGQLSEAEMRGVDEHRGHYENPAWTWHR